MKVGYIRVSTRDQNPARQVEALRNYGADKIFEEKVSSKNLDRPELKNLLGFIRDGDIVVVESYSRLARSTKDFCSLLTSFRRRALGLCR